MISKKICLLIGAIWLALFPVVAFAQGSDQASTILGLNPRGFLWAVFGLCIAAFMIVDLGWLNRQAHKISIKSAVYQSIFWFVLASAFGGLIWQFVGHNLAADYMTAYLTEKMLSVDNLFVIMVLFAFFRIPDMYHHRILYWGILGAVVFRGVFLGLGAAVISQAHWILYIFGAILVWSGYKLMQGDDDENDVESMKAYKFVKRYLPFSLNHHGHFFLTENGKWKATLLFAVLVMVEITDILFAVDSIPAVFSISQDIFIIFTSNIFAIMGLRALFFVVEGILKKFHHMSKGVSLVLVFIGLKMLLTAPAYFGEKFGYHGLPEIHISSLVSLGVIVLLLVGSLVASIIFPQKDDDGHELIETIEDNHVRPKPKPATPQASTD